MAAHLTITTPSIPPLETERCFLRAHEEKDFPAYLALRAHPDVFRFTAGRAPTEEQAWRRLTSVIGHWALRGYGMWAIEEKATGELIGEAGFGDWRREGFSSRHGLPEAGWWLAAHKHGSGYAREAVRAAHHWADRTLAARCTFCGILAPNLASIRLAEAVGYRLQEEAVFLEQRALVFERGLPLSAG